LVANKSILEIEVQDESFQAFLSAFHEFRDETAQVPKDWDKLAEAIDGPRKKLKDLTKEQKVALSGVTSGMRSTADSIDKAASAQGHFTGGIHKSAKAMGTLGNNAKKVAGVLKTIAGFGAAIGGMALGVAGLGIGAMFALGDMSNKVVQKQYAARSEGLNIGQRGGFAAGYGGVMGGKSNAESFLSTVAGAQTTPQGMALMASMGINATQNAQKSAEQMAERVGSMYRDSRKSGASALVAAQEVSNRTLHMFSISEIRALGHVHHKSWAAMEKNASLFSKQMALSDKGARKWVHFWGAITGTLSSVENTILSVLSDGKMLGSIQGAIRDAGSWLVMELRGIDVRESLDEFGNWVAHTATYPESSKFKTQLASFVSDVEMVGSEILAVAKNLKWLIPKSPTEYHGERGNKAFKKPSDNPYNWNDNAKHAALFGLLPGDRNMGPNYWKINPANPSNAHPSPPIAPPSRAVQSAAKALAPYRKDIDAAAKASGVKRSVIAGEIWAEDSGGKANAVSGGTYKGHGGKQLHTHGIGQFRRSTWREFAHGLPYSDANNPKDAIMVMGRFIAANMKNHRTRSGLESAYSGDPRGSAALAIYRAANQVGAAGYAEMLSTLREIAQNTSKGAQVHVHNGANPGSRVAVMSHAAGM
jgi:hypothetical protein